MQYSVKPLLTKLKPDLFFSPDGLCVLGTQTKQIPVIHDLNFEHHPEFHRFWARKYYRYFFPRFARISHHILTVSEFSKNDISKTYSVPEDKISVIYNGVSEKFHPVSDEIKYSTKKKFTNGRNYFVYVGSLHPRKNINGLFKAFSEFKKQEKSNIALVLAGPVYWGMKEIYHSLTSLQLENDVIFTNRLSDEDLNNILASSLGLVYVPFYEGFGIPVIEAFAAGVPVITSNVTSLPEVAADAAFLVNPHNPREIAQCMHYIMENVNE
jgi:glycosyltransferase involved in cell wall biosynthesis